MHLQISHPVPFLVANFQYLIDNEFRLNGSLFLHSKIPFLEKHCNSIHSCQTQNSVNGGVTALIWGASPQTRSDRRKDRVETNPEQLAAASAQAEISLMLYF
ncbi:Mov34/MPN/PAD-1 family protein [Prunus dulcis]|uniref:Mov34/MPN/PAD-1 family protein n=1 Tax=Prunus dulcis TaxID=3755 RepID=A0A4Y1R4N8_PRUDU|nr:Mov34/MPN/PAD-1 family protein [Prunus dulcis]